MSRATIEHALTRHGLRLRGGWVPAAGESLPALPNGLPVGLVWMVGQVGSECWDAFAGSTFYRDGLPDPLDRWSRSIGDELAQQERALAIYPFEGPPYYPFQRWAARVEPLQTSPLMLQIHPRFGLWHAYRFALALAQSVDAPLPPVTASAQPVASEICLNCVGQPCLTACPVQAFDAGGFVIERCATHLQRPAGRPCMEGGCLARRACPVGTEHAYVARHAAFHMAAFAKRHQVTGR